MMHELIRKEVEVITPEIIYRGILMEVTETEISLQSVNGWISIPMERVLDVRAVD
jgi:hypothetical protein